MIEKLELEKNLDITLNLIKMAEEEYSRKDVPVFLRDRSDEFLGITKKKEEENIDISYTSSVASEIPIFDNGSISIDDKVNGPIKKKVSTKVDYNKIETNKLKDASEFQNDYNDELKKGLQEGGLIDRLRVVYGAPLASEESINQWVEHDMSNKSPFARIRMYNELKEDIYKEGIKKDWDIKKYNQELNRMQKRLFPDAEFQEIE